ncbi:MAG: NADPH:quinone oxidoreductase family protein [Alphaproteobacteria bacterium]|nr:NADPH:quinone oxidoreductase family protein [Alphaproteobacteria bacterium]MBL6939755.1 NADPH:quinone oxidoreductase family protein [Alphaproteobacteria bacterium]MBL7096923.1 NADPH:quinone oxidoreductase family protein [Alphaproteobacteria bacterium]
MKALLCTHYGPPEEMELHDVPSPAPGKNQVLVDVKACGVNFPDVLMLADKYQFKPALPFPPGGEVAGTVKALGEGVTNLKIGDRVAVSIGNGGFAEEVLADSRRCVPMPANVSFEVASAFIVTYGTSYHALKDRAKLKAGETLVVLGAAGGVGLSAVELGVAMGAKVIAGASSQEKVDLAMKHGAVDGFVYPRLPLSRDQQKALSDTIKAKTGGQGADVLYDPVGDQYAEPALRAMNWEGRYLVIGFAAGEIPRVPLNLTLLKGCDVLGVFWGMATQRDPKHANESLREIMQMISDGKLHPDVSASFPLAEGGKAIRMLQDRKAMGKVVVTM